MVYGNGGLGGLRKDPGMRRLASVLMLGVSWGVAQQPVATAPAAATMPAAGTMVSPQAAFEESTRPVELVRKSIANWSDAELTALGVAMKKAAIACEERKPEGYAGDDLVVLAKLCSFGQQWPESKAAAARYIAAEDAGKTQLSLAYALQLDAALHLHDLKEIVADARAMLEGVPYDATVNEAADGAISYMQLAYTDEAIALEAIRQPLLRAAIAQAKPVTARHTLYASGLEEAKLLQYMNRPPEATASVSALDAAFHDGLVASGVDETQMSADEMVPIGEARRQYGLLGKPLPAIPLSLSLANVAEAPALNARFGAGTALLVFPDWCAQCVAARKDLWKAEKTDQGFVQLLVLLAENMPDKALLAQEADIPRSPANAVAQPTHVDKTAASAEPGGPPEKQKTAAELLLGSQTIVVPPETTALFAADDFPFVVMLDHAGIVRFAGSAPETVLRPGDFLDRLVEHVAEFWPPQRRTAATR